MIYLILSILSSSTIFVIFKLFNKYKVDTLQAIVVNYFAAFACGILLYNKPIVINELTHSSWFTGALCLGVLFISIFNVMALTAQKNGLSVASVASKMSFIFPVIFGILMLNESSSIYKILGIVLAIAAVYLTSIKNTNEKGLSKSMYLPLLLFLGSGVIDTTINYVSPKNDIPIFSAVIFLFAGCLGLILLAYKAIVNKHYFKLKSLPFGILLGVVNYASIHFLLKALKNGLESSKVFTINNVAIVTLSTIIGLLLFKERISAMNWLGIIIAFVSIVLTLML